MDPSTTCGELSRTNGHTILPKEDLVLMDVDVSVWGARERLAPADIDKAPRRSRIPCCSATGSSCPRTPCRRPPASGPRAGRFWSGLPLPHREQRDDGLHVSELRPCQPARPGLWCQLD